MRRKNRKINSVEQLEEEEEWQPKGPCRFHELPQGLVMDILSRLSLKTLFKCRCVYKSWLFITADPHFTHLCLSRVPIDDPFYVGNPVSGEYITIPLPKEACLKYSFLGLGYSASTNEYKVLQSSSCINKAKVLDAECEALIYRIGTGGGAWRSIGKTPPDEIRDPPFSSFLHGALHWISAGSQNFVFIHSFNFETEKFRTLPPPGYFKPIQQKSKQCLKLGVLEGCLFLCVCGDEPRQFDMWVMKDYGVEESWTKTLVFEGLYPPPELNNDAYEPLVFLRNGDILLSYNDQIVVCYNQGRKSLRKARVTRTKLSFRAIGYKLTIHP
ncbi:F-box protein At3g07870-like [Rosa rugosa]|uniref:F-box protein At3g07870-like n=1 Tax=Rosa rugosa TaxID=74645 RepID=UPI002B40CF3F|nr:F-box protein At3g07870-like [Rosa rugosa]